jgi:hypothetical protein
LQAWEFGHARITRVTNRWDDSPAKKMARTLARHERQRAEFNERAVRLAELRAEGWDLRDAAPLDIADAQFLAEFTPNEYDSGWHTLDNGERRSPTDAELARVLDANRHAVIGAVWLLRGRGAAALARELASWADDESRRRRVPL